MQNYCTNNLLNIFNLINSYLKQFSLDRTIMNENLPKQFLKLCTSNATEKIQNETLQTSDVLGENGM